VFPLELPPLRQRKEDMPVLVEHFAKQVCAQNGWRGVPFSQGAIEALKEYSWPGNIRELRNVVERLLLLAESEVDAELVNKALPASRTVEGFECRGGATVDATGPLAQRVLQFERETVLAELERNGRHVTQTAKALGLERSHLYKKCQQLGIDLHQQQARE
jgi:two-component system, NtrC family, nitrogen regulation response regulator NtrX